MEFETTSLKHLVGAAVCRRPLSVPRAVTCPLRGSPGSLTPRHQAGCEQRGGRPQALCTGGGAGSPHHTPRSSLCRSTPLRAALPCPGTHETALQLLARASVASRCPVVPHARRVHFFQIERRGFSTQAEHVAGTAGDSERRAAAVRGSGKSRLCQVALNQEASGFGKMGYLARGRRHALTPHISSRAGQRGRSSTRQPDRPVRAVTSVHAEALTFRKAFT